MHTSGNYERYREYDGKRYQHIIDPRSGLPAETIVSASVIHPNGATADAAATALVIAGPEGWEAVARRMGVTQAILVDDQGTVYLTPQMQGRVRFQTPPARLVSRRLTPQPRAQPKARGITDHPLPANLTATPL